MRDSAKSLHLYTLVIIVNLMFHIKMLLSSLLLLLAGGFSLVCTGQAVVYYVAPTFPPSSDCPAQPCQTLEYYFAHQHSFFCNQSNVTMKLMKGEHTLGQQKYYMDCRRTNYVARALFIEDLETFEMIGLGPAAAYDVIIYLHTDINLLNVSVSYFGFLVFLCMSCPVCIFLPGNYAGDHDDLPASSIPGQASETTVNIMDTETYITTVNEMFFDGVLFEQ